MDPVQCIKDMKTQAKVKRSVFFTYHVFRKKKKKDVCVFVCCLLNCVEPSHHGDPVLKDLHTHFPTLDQSIQDT